jgi:hypothetical protein
MLAGFFQKPKHMKFQCLKVGSVGFVGPEAIQTAENIATDAIDA